jgi:hypothetical protein
MSLFTKEEVERRLQVLFAAATSGHYDIATARRVLDDLRAHDAEQRAEWIRREECLSRSHTETLRLLAERDRFSDELVIVRDRLEACQKQNAVYASAASDRADLLCDLREVLQIDGYTEAVERIDSLLGLKGEVPGG